MNKDKSSEMNMSKDNKAKKRNPYNVLLIAGILILSIMGLVYLYFLQTYKQIDYVKIPSTNEDLGITDDEDKINIFENNKSIINIALFGVDKRDDEERGRSDSIMILTIDPINNNIKLSSLMRDSKVSIKGYDENKLGHAYSYGGPELALHTINDNFRLNIRHFATINYGGLVKVIDSIGGVNVNIKPDELEMVNKYIGDTAHVEGIEWTPISDPGYQLVTGVQAVGYSRIRKVGDGDYERTQRQRIVLSGIIRELTELSVLELPGVIKELAPYVETNITSSYMLKLGSSILNTGISDIRQARFPSDENSYGDTINGTWFLIFDEYKTIDEMHEFIFEND